VTAVYAIFICFKCLLFAIIFVSTFDSLFRRAESQQVFVFSASLPINIASVTANGVDLSPIPSFGLCVCRSVGWSVPKVYCGKTAHWTRMPFRMVSGVGWWMGVLDGSANRRRGRDSFGVNSGRPIVTMGTLLHSCQSDALFPNHFGQDLFHITSLWRQNASYIDFLWRSCYSTAWRILSAQTLDVLHLSSCSIRFELYQTMSIKLRAIIMPR